MMAAASHSAAQMAADIRSGKARAVEIVDRALGAICARNGDLGAFTRVFVDEARAAARQIDVSVAEGKDPGPLAGVPFAVKDLFDVAGMTTTAGATLRRNAPAAVIDAEVVSRMKAKGAVLVGTCNMDEFAYGFATVNAAFGTTRNPHDPTRLAGGSSGGSAAAVGAGLVPIALGSDTNGSIRVPASLCSVYGLRPTHGHLNVAGAFPFVDSLDVVGSFATTLDDLVLSFEAMGGISGAVPHSPRVAKLTGWFDESLAADVARAVSVVSNALAPLEGLDLPGAAAARSAAFLLTAAEGGARHLRDLRRIPLEFDPAIRDRLIAGATIPASILADAGRVRANFTAVLLDALKTYDVLVTAATPCVAPASMPAPCDWATRKCRPAPILAY